MDPALIDRIYESSVVPELWPVVLEELGQIAAGTGGSLFITKADRQYWTASLDNRETAETFVNGRWFSRGQVAARLFGSRHAGFLTDFDLFSPQELGLEPLWRDLLRPLGIGWSVGTSIPIPTGENAVLVVTRRTERGPVERNVVDKLDELRPHLARSAFLSARLGLERARVASETLGVVGLPALVLNGQGKVLAANRLIETMTGYVEWRARDRVSMSDRAADQLLRDAIATIDLTGGSSVRSFPVRDMNADVMMVAHVVPIRLSARDIFVRCSAVLILTPVALPQAPPVELVQSLFDLTPAEARVARGLAAGKTVDDIAADGGTSATTIRTQVRGVMEKTGCNRQVDIVALLTAISARPLTSAT